MAIVFHPEITDSARAAFDHWRETDVGAAIERAETEWTLRRGSIGLDLTSIELVSRHGTIWFDLFDDETVTVDWRAPPPASVDVSKEELCATLEDLGSDLARLEALAEVELEFQDAARPSGLPQTEDARLILFELLEGAAMRASDVASALTAAAKEVEASDGPSSSSELAWPDGRPAEDADAGVANERPGELVGLPGALLELVPDEAQVLLRILRHSSTREIAITAQRGGPLARWSRGRRSVEATWQIGDGHFILETPGEMVEGLWDARKGPRSFDEKVTDAVDRHLRRWRAALAEAEHLVKAIRGAPVAEVAPYREVLEALEDLIAEAEDAILEEADELAAAATPDTDE